jgi:hypothetical protein
VGQPFPATGRLASASDSSQAREALLDRLLARFACRERSMGGWQQPAG